MNARDVAAEVPPQAARYTENSGQGGECNAAPRRFYPAYLEAIFQTIGKNWTHNFDERRFGPERRAARSARDALRDRITEFLRRRGLVRAWGTRQQLASAVAFVAPHADEFDWLYQRLEDAESRSTLVDVLAYRALGHRRVKLPTNSPEYRAGLARLEAMARDAESIPLGFFDYRAHRLHLGSHGYPIELFLTPSGVMNTFVQQQYRCAIAGETIEAGPGDIVIDAGGCYGDTALYFAHKVGAAGRVFTIEFLPENLAVLRRNLALNPELEPRISLVEAPLWSRSGEPLFILGNGPATRVSPTASDPNASRLDTVSIDDLVQRGVVPRIDFVKMDIEGAEVESLAGAEQSIRAFRPTLAISVYHRLSDFWTVPRFLDGLGLGYRFWMRHYTIHTEETVLYARASH